MVKVRRPQLTQVASRRGAPAYGLAFAAIVLASMAPLSAMPQANDDCSNAIDLGNMDGVFGFDITSATSAGPDACLKFGSAAIHKDIWFVWSPPFDGDVTFSTCDLTGIDTKIAVYTGGCGTLSLEACNDDYCGLQSEVTFSATASTSYLLRLGTFSPKTNGGGSFELSTSGEDCNGNGMPDDTEDLPDCNDNGTPDVCEDFADCNSNGIPDECDLDCNENYIPDECEKFDDCNKNDIPDECEPDCDYDGIPDDCEHDCDGDGIPDDCNDRCELDCVEFNRSEDLTPLDTLTSYTRHHNPEHDQGYLYAYAVDAQDRAIASDDLIGSLLFVDGYNILEYSVNAVDYRASVAAGMSTDVDGDGILDLNGLEYEKTAGELLVPHFFGQNGRIQSDLITIGLSGGTQFETVVQYYIYNDDEDQFSSQSTFTCWDKSPVSDISGVFNNHWLRNFSGQNSAEGFGMQEYGWFRLFGKTAHSAFVDIPDPAIYAVYVEHLSGSGAADLPFETCTQSGHLLPQSVGGDNDEGFSASSDRDCLERIARRRPGSLLLFTEFDNRFGMVTVITVTNTSETRDVRVHYVYRGRYES